MDTFKKPNFKNPDEYAFPVGFHPQGNSADQQGMLLRDWFAGQALNGWIIKFDATVGFDAYASNAYKLADAMLRERAKP